MLERCISLEPTFTPAYLELIKLRPSFEAGKLLRDVVRLNSIDQDRIVQYGFWLLENGKTKQEQKAFSQSHNRFDKRILQIL